MCGIGGILRTDGKPIPEEWLDAIDARIAWRGPDGHGRFRDRVEFIDERGEKRTVEVAFVHRRLSIIDHEDGHQPMVSERGRNDREGLVAVVFNGCIYNHRELREELEAKGHRFVSDHSDTEVLIHGWREWGEYLADHLEGMYAFAIWDRTRQWLVLSRDAYGEKPLYYTAETLQSRTDFTGDFMFASARGALCSRDCREHGVSPEAFGWIPEYLRLGYVPRVPGIGNVLTARALGPEESVAATIRGELIPLDADPLGYGLYTERPEPQSPMNDNGIEGLLDLAVTRRLEADVPLGCFLSGGVDSSLVTLFAKRHKPDLRSFTVRMPDPRYDESKYAARVAAHLGVNHTTLDAAMHPSADLVHLVALLGEPFGDSSILPTYWVSQAAREHVKVALSGDGGDELFLGYERYFAARVVARFHRALALLPSTILTRTHPRSFAHKLGRLGEMARDYPLLGVEAMESLFRARDIEMLADVLPTRLDADHDAPAWAAASDPMVDLRDFDLYSYLPDDLLRKVDTASMASGLEVRSPLLDRDLTHAVMNLPIEQLVPSGQRKGLLRRIARKHLPREIVDRPKMGFAIPIGEWFRSDYGGMKTLLLDHLNSVEPFGSISLNRNAVRRFIDEHMSGKRDHGQRLFTLLTLSIWAKSQQVNKSTSQK